MFLHEERKESISLLHEERKERKESISLLHEERKESISLRVVKCVQLLNITICHICHKSNGFFAFLLEINKEISR
jgi:hypothetical protein